MNKRIRTGLITTALVGGSLFGVTQVAGTANAQVDDGSTDTEQVQDAPTQGERGPRGPGAGNGDGETAGQGARGPGGRRGPGGEHGDHAARAEATADLLGIEVDDLRTALQDGQTLAQVADANGVDPQTIVDAKTDGLEERLATAVEEGRFTEQEAADKLVEATDRITDRVNNGRPERGERPDRGDRPERPAEVDDAADQS